jgi:hypothetical protein
MMASLKTTRTRWHLPTGLGVSDSDDVIMWHMTFRIEIFYRQWVKCRLFPNIHLYSPKHGRQFGNYSKIKDKNFKQRRTIKSITWCVIGISRSRDSPSLPLHHMYEVYLFEHKNRRFLSAQHFVERVESLKYICSMPSICICSLE